MRFLVFAVVECKNEVDEASTTVQQGENLFVIVEEVRLVALTTPIRMPSEFFLPCPRDALMTRLAFIEDEGGDVYFGKCGKGHQLMLSTTENSPE